MGRPLCRYMNLNVQNAKNYSNCSYWIPTKKFTCNVQNVNPKTSKGSSVPPLTSWGRVLLRPASGPRPEAAPAGPAQPVTFRVQPAKNPQDYEPVPKRPILANLCVKLKFQSSKYSMYSCGWNFRLPWPWANWNVLKLALIDSRSRVQWQKQQFLRGLRVFNFVLVSNAERWTPNRWTVTPFQRSQCVIDNPCSGPYCL